MDIARIVAVLAVIAIHVTSYMYSSYERLPIHAWLVADGVYSATRWPVTVFVMVSGYLLLGKHEPARVFYRKRLQRILIPLAAWTAIYWLFLLASRPNGHGPDWFVRALVNGDVYTHLYFLYIMVGLALITPILRAIVGAGDDMVLLGAVIGIGYAMAQRLLQEAGVGPRSNGLSLFIPYVGFYLLGYWLGKRSPTARQVEAAAVIALLTVAGASIATWLLLSAGGGHLATWVEAYFGLPGVVEAVAVFIVLRATPHRLASWRLAPALGGLAFGAYLTSPLVGATLPSLLRYPSGFVTAVMYVGVRTIMVAAASALIVAAMRRVPLLRTIA